MPIEPRGYSGRRDRLRGSHSADHFGEIACLGKEIKLYTQAVYREDAQPFTVSPIANHVTSSA